MQRVITRVEAGNGSSLAAGLTSWERERGRRIDRAPSQVSSPTKGLSGGRGVLLCGARIIGLLYSTPRIIDLSSSCQAVHEIAILASSTGV